MEQDALAKAHPVFIIRAKPRQQLETFLMLALTIYTTTLSRF